MRAKFRRALIIGAVFSLSACTTIQSATRQAVRYNSAFSEARNQILLLNILRAKYHEPLQFSTISTVSGPMRGNINVGSAFEWIFHDNDKLNPSGSFTFRDPTITITPLDSKEFREGMTKPLEPKYYFTLLKQGWTAQVVKDLVLTTPIFCTPKKPAKEALVREVWVTGAEAAKMLREGAGDGMKIQMADDPKGAQDRVRLQFIKKDDGMKVEEEFCPENQLLDTDKTHFRSPLAIINHLGRDEPKLIDIQGPVRQAPPGSLVSTFYRGGTYYVSSSSAETLAVVAEIIGFQTTAAALEANKPTVTVSGD